MCFAAIDEEDTPKIATEFITQVSVHAISYYSIVYRLPATSALGFQCTVHTGHSISAMYLYQQCFARSSTAPITTHVLACLAAQ